MFWKFNLASTHIDSLLEKEDVTLQELLDEDDILQECKARHKKLIDFLIRPDNLREMVNMVTEEPSEDIEEKQRYRYPNTCCEVLTCDVTQINDCLTGDSVYINKLYGFLEMKGPLNPLLASFVSKVIGLLTVKKSEMIFKYLKSKSDFVGTLLTHIGTSAMVDLLLRLITCIESTKLKFEMIEWLNEEKLVERLVDQVVPSIEEDFHTNAAQFLCDIVRLGREQPSQIQESPQPYPLLATLESEPVIGRLLNNILDGEKNESVIVNGLLVVQILLDIKKVYEGEVDQRSSLEIENITQGVNHVLYAITPRIKDFHSLLLNPPKPRYCAMPTTIGILEPPLGNTRLQITKLITALIQTNSHEVNVELANSGTIGVMLDLYFKYIWNNFLHSQVEQCIYLILNNSPTEIDNRKEHPLLEQIFIKCNLIQRILDSWEENDQYEHRIGGRRRGYMGHLTKIANHITECIEKGENSELIKEYLKEIPEEYRNKWTTFVSSTLAETNKQNTIELVQGHPLHSSSEDDDTDFRDLPFNQDAVMQQAFSDYQLQMTSNFIDTFGFNEHDFADQDGKIDTTFNEKISSIDFNIRADEDSAPNATMFEQACNERIQQFDDNDSDEEIWEKKEVILFENSPVRPTGMSTDSLGSDDQEEEEDNTDSDEELDSPKCILQQPQEKMDVDVEAMETSPWDAALVPSETPDQKWANFDLKMSENNWADFSSFNSSLERIPRSSSPIAMDTGDTVSSSGCEDKNSPRSPQTRTVETAAKDENGKSSKEDALWSGDTKKNVTNKEWSKDDSSQSDSNQSANSDQTASSDDAEAEKVVNCSQERLHFETDEELYQNFNFLSSAGLIKPSNFEEASSSSSSTTVVPSVSTTESSSCVSTTECSSVATSECSGVSTTDCSSVATTSVSTASNDKDPEGVSEDKSKSNDDSVAKSTTSNSDGNSESSKSNLIENVRSQAIEAMEKYEKAITASMKNGPV
ncbi:serine/threonine-protein phosphatase 6 regulatory subunit 3 isoform X3 [Octopus sinensis]|uniref:Serine/threonine-protein phosphatase 6 regulatory subunit 3 isoform X3 n=1 Tax=Octopus sinensis TaxID=2607531 RepID=A0A6P7TMY1_9MOLL|nr:serine/threonine-protein phosphatase 6 regulatory subunit 3 isoform X3 [Octopus sinensis]